MVCFYRKLEILIMAIMSALTNLMAQTDQTACTSFEEHGMAVRFAAFGTIRDSEHRRAKVSKPEPNHTNHPNQFSGQNPNFRNSLRGFDRHKEHHLKGLARTGICKILPSYRDMGPNVWCAKGLDCPEIGLHAKGLDQISGVLFVITACIYEYLCCVNDH